MKAVVFAIALFTSLASAQNIPLPADCTSQNLGAYLFTAVNGNPNLGIQGDTQLGAYLQDGPTKANDAHVWWHLAAIQLINAQANAVIAACGYVVDPWAWPNSG